MTAAVWHPIALGQRALGCDALGAVCEGLLLLPLRSLFSASVFRPGLKLCCQAFNLQLTKQRKMNFTPPPPPPSLLIICVYPMWLLSQIFSCPCVDTQREASKILLVYVGQTRQDFWKPRHYLTLFSGWDSEEWPLDLIVL